MNRKSEQNYDHTDNYVCYQTLRATSEEKDMLLRILTSIFSNRFSKWNIYLIYVGCWYDYFLTNFQLYCVLFYSEPLLSSRRSSYSRLSLVSKLGYSVAKTDQKPYWCISYSNGVSENTEQLSLKKTFQFWRF